MSGSMQARETLTSKAIERHILRVDFIRRGP